jgi:hypothetical protein
MGKKAGLLATVVVAISVVGCTSPRGHRPEQLDACEYPLAGQVPALGSIELWWLDHPWTEYGHIYRTHFIRRRDIVLDDEEESATGVVHSTSPPPTRTSTMQLQLVNEAGLAPEVIEIDDRICHALQDHMVIPESNAVCGGIRFDEEDEWGVPCGDSFMITGGTVHIISPIHSRFEAEIRDLEAVNHAGDRFINLASLTLKGP